MMFDDLFRALIGPAVAVTIPIVGEHWSVADRRPCRGCGPRGCAFQVIDRPGEVRA